MEGKHLANHLSNSNIFTSKFKLLELLEALHKSMLSGVIQSTHYRSPSEFYLQTYCLAKNQTLSKFLQSSNSGLWVMKNTTTDADHGITLIDDISSFK